MQTQKKDGASAFILGNVILGSIAPLTKYIFDTVPLNIYLFPKYFIPGLMVLAFAVIFKQYKSKLSFGEYRQIVILSLLNIVLCNLFYYMALQTLPALYAILSSMLFPAAVYLLSIKLLHENVSKKAIVGIMICVAGAFLLIVGSHFRGSVVTFSSLGLLLLVMSILAQAYGTVLSKPYLSSAPILQLLGLQLLIGSLMFLPQFVYENAKFDWSTIPLDQLLVFVAICAVLTPAGNLAYFLGVKKINVSSNASILYVSTIVGIVIAAVLLGERLTPLYILSTAIIVLGIWVGKSTIFEVWIRAQKPYRFSLLRFAREILQRIIHLLDD